MSILFDIHKSHLFIDGPLHLEVNFYMPMPSSWSEKKKAKMDGKPHVFKPDFSNLLKFVEDCATGICYKDDCLIASVTGKKVYSTASRTEIILTEIIDEENTPT
jgi:Holliday junction resolvase RusA-like endonuclease